MGHITLLNMSLFYTLALIVIVSSRHIQNSEDESEQDPSKSGKPGEYLWYQTGSEQTVARSSIARSSQGTVDSDENEELNSGAVPSEDEKDLSGSGEPNEAEYMSGSGSYPSSYMVDAHETDKDNSVEAKSDTPTEDLANSDQDKQQEASADFSGENKEEDEGQETESPDHEIKEQDSSGSANVEQEDESDRATDKKENGKHIASPKRRSEIYRKSKVTKGNSDSEYDKLFKDFKNDGDLGLDVEDDDDDGDLDDALSEEETNQLISEGNKDETGLSKSAIFHRDGEGGDLSSMFREVSGDSSSSLSSDESRAFNKKSKKKTPGSKMKEILSKLDSDIFRGHKSEEHEQHHSKEHRDHHEQQDHQHHQGNKTAKETESSRALNHHADSGIFNGTANEEESSRALSHHADNGIVNGSVSNMTLEAQKVKKHPKHKHYHHHGHHHKHRHYHHHHHHRHHHHQQLEIETHKDDVSANQIPGSHLQQSNSSAQYSVQSPSIYYPAGPAVAAQPQPSPEEISLMQFYHQSSNGYAYHSVKNADRTGAVCLDGSTPGYFLRKGSGKGSKNWIIYLQGGAWCESEDACLGRSRMHLGSSLFFKPLGNPGGILSNNDKENPEFYNWNVAYLPYCDGSSFSGNRSDPVQVEGSLLYFRGFRILDSTISELLSDTDLKEASHVVFSGTSAGGLAVMLHADYVRSKLPKKVSFRALADSGFFLDTASRKQKKHRKFRKIMQSVFKLHDCTNGVPQKCVDNMSGKELWKCIFPQYFLPFVKSRMFIVNPLYDSWQLGHVWEIACAARPYSCTPKELKQIKKFRKTTLKAMKGVIKGSKNLALFADSCIDHGQVIFNAQWNTIKVMRKSISSSFAKWYHKPRKGMYFIDEDQYPANPTCISKDVDKRSEIFTEGF